MRVDHWRGAKGLARELLALDIWLPMCLDGLRLALWLLIGIYIVGSLGLRRWRVPVLLLPSRVLLQLSGGELLQGRRLMVLRRRLLGRIVIGLMLRRRDLGKVLLVVVVVCLLLLPLGLLKLGLVVLLLLETRDGRGDHGLLLLHREGILRLGHGLLVLAIDGLMRHLLRLAVCRIVVIKPALLLLLLVDIKGWRHY